MCVVAGGSSTVATSCSETRPMRILSCVSRIPFEEVEEETQTDNLLKALQDWRERMKCRKLAEHVEPDPSGAEPACPDSEAD